MKYMTVWTISPENEQAAIKRFQEADPKVPGVKVLGRWHEVGTGHGFTLVETDDPVALARMNAAWCDLVDQRVHPVIDDAQATASLR